MKTTFKKRTETIHKKFLKYKNWITNPKNREQEVKGNRLMEKLELETGITKQINTQKLKLWNKDFGIGQGGTYENLKCQFEEWLGKENLTETELSFELSQKGFYTKQELDSQL